MSRFRCRGPFHCFFLHTSCFLHSPGDSLDLLPAALFPQPTLEHNVVTVSLMPPEVGVALVRMASPRRGPRVTVPYSSAFFLRSAAFCNFRCDASAFCDCISIAVRCTVRIVTSSVANTASHALATCWVVAANVAKSATTPGANRLRPSCRANTGRSRSIKSAMLSLRWSEDCACFRTLTFVSASCCQHKRSVRPFAQWITEHGLILLLLQRSRSNVSVDRTRDPDKNISVVVKAKVLEER